MQAQKGLLSGTRTRIFRSLPIKSSRLIVKPVSAAILDRNEITLAGDNGRSSARLIHLSWASQKDALSEATASNRKLLVYLPGTDGTGQSILTQQDRLEAHGWDLWTLFLPVTEQSGWTELTARTADLIRELSTSHLDKVTIVGESFGGCLALRLALWEPSLIERLVLMNPATSFNRSLNGLSSFISGTNLLGLFPQQLYSVAQATLLPLLVDSQRVTPKGQELLRRMILMQPPESGRAADDSRSNDLPAAPLPVPPLPLPVRVPYERLYGPAAAANFRVGLLREGDLPDSQLKRISVPTVVICSARDRMLPSIQEGSRLLHLIAESVRIILPDSGHAALLEREVDLASILMQGQAKALQAQKAGRVTSPPAKWTPPRSAAPLSPPHTSSSTPSTLSSPLPVSRPQLSTQGLSSPETSPWNEWAQRLAPWRDLVSPVVVGAENLPPEGSKDWTRPMLFVGNHGKMGFYDTPLLMYELYVRGYRIRGLAHPGHWNGPFGPFIESFGAVRASPMAAFRLLRNNEKVLLFPGGAKEVVKKKGQEYQLLWKDTPDFVRLAAKCNAIIVPFAAVGADDAYETLMETDEQVDHPLLGPVIRGLLNRVGGEGGLDPYESIFPLTKLPVPGLPISIPSPIPIPNLTRLYFKFGIPFDTGSVKLDVDNDEACQGLYDNIRETINRDLAELIQLRDSDGDREVSARVRHSFDAVLETLSEMRKAAAFGPDALDNDHQPAGQTDFYAAGEERTDASGSADSETAAQEQDLVNRSS